MEEYVSKYYQLKQQQKETEQELLRLRDTIIAHCAQTGETTTTFGPYRVKLTQQARKEYDEGKLYEALPDLELWRMLSKPDTAKIASLIKLRVIAEETISEACAVREITLLQVDKI